MSSVGRMCLYCSRPIATEDRVALCDRCYAAHHEACWDRNGRCSTFRCAGVPRTMRGEDLPTTLQVAMTRANETPTECPYCAGRVYAGAFSGKRPPHAQDQPAGTGMVFICRDGTDARGGLTGLYRRMRGQPQWYLPGATLRARSCGQCRRFFLWGVPMDDAFLERCREPETERYCPHCSTALRVGELCLNPQTPGGARFECAETPEFHSDWLGHNVLDRFFLNRWNAPMKGLPALSCPDCQYTEVAGRPVYRFL